MRGREAVDKEGIGCEGWRREVGRKEKKDGIGREVSGKLYVVILWIKALGHLTGETRTISTGS